MAPARGVAVRLSRTRDRTSAAPELLAEETRHARGYPHATSHIVVINQDSFVDASSWSGANEIEKLRATYGWDVREALAWALLGHPLGVTQRAPKRARVQVLNRSAEELEPEAMRAAKREDTKVERKSERG